MLMSMPSFSHGVYDFSSARKLSTEDGVYFSQSCYIATSQLTETMWAISAGTTINGGELNVSSLQYGIIVSPGLAQGYVYSTNQSSYPNGGESGGYYYDQRTTVTSPTSPTSLTYPATITSLSVDVSWTASSSNVPAYAVNEYEISYSVNEGSTWTVAGTTTGTSLNVNIPLTATSIQFRVRAKDSNNQWSSYATGSTSQVLMTPAMTVPSIAMQSQNITVNWTSIDGATSYTLQRKADTDDDWVQVYSGADLTFTEAVGTWSSVQYRVNAVFSSGTGEWATSSSIPVMSASALVISGQDEDLGTLVNDVPYTISTDTGNQIAVKTTVNGAVIFDDMVASGTAERIPVLDLISGSGTIVIEASVETDSGPVSATRTWTYTKAPITFPNSGSVGQLQKDGKNVWPITLAEAIRMPAKLGGSLDKTIETLAPLMLSGAKIEAGSYVGTGTYGSSNPNRLTFSGKPVLVFIAKDLTNYLNNAGWTGNSNAYGAFYAFIRGNPNHGTFGVVNSSSYRYSIATTWEDQSLEWYINKWDTSQSGAIFQLNDLGATYFYAAVLL